MSDLKWTPIKIRIGQIRPWSANPRMSTKAQAERLIKSERELGQIQTLAVSPFDGDFVDLYDGHQRCSAWMTVKDPSFEVQALQSNRHLSEDERRKVSVLLHMATGSWDWNALSSWNTAELKDWGMDADALKGWNTDAENLKFMLEVKKEDDAQASDEIETKDRFEEVANKWKTANNQLWQAGNHFIFCGDSLDVESYKRLLQGRMPKLINADPPYGVNIVASNGYVGGGESDKGMIPFGGVKKRGYVGGGEQIKARTGFYPIEKRRFGSADASKPFGSKAERGSDGAAHVVGVGKYPIIIGDENTETAKQSSTLLLEKYPDAYHAWWGANYYVDVLEPSPCWLVWNKQTTGNFADCELAWTNAENSAKLFTHRWNGMLRDSERGKRWHPTQKPAALAEWTIGLFTDKGDIVLDPFGGAGWTLLAAETAKRQAFIIEKSYEYVAVMLERWSVQTNQTPALVDAL